MYFNVDGKKMDVRLAMPEMELDDVLAELLWTDKQITGEERFPAEQTEAEFSEMVEFLESAIREENANGDSWFRQMNEELENPHNPKRYELTVEEVTVKTKVYRIYANDTTWEGEFTTYDGAKIKTVAKEDIDGRPYTEITITAENPERELNAQISDGLAENLHVTSTVEEHRYGMRLRGFGPGCQPMRGLIDGVESSGKYWNVLTYNRKLTPEEIRDYELDELEGGE